MSDPRDPHEVLAAVRRLESELAEVRARATNPLAGEIDRLRAQLVEDAATERRRIVEDLELVVSLMGDAWRNTRGQLDDVRAQLAATRAELAALRAGLEGARLEFRFPAATNGNGNGMPYPTAASAAADRPSWPTRD
ncbi:MAG: hypothetical protein U0Y82_07845 [Thermoleophilia bacterium]